MKTNNFATGAAVRLLLATCLLLPAFGAGAVDIFLDLGDIKGESQDSVHPDEIVVLSWTEGLSNSASVDSATGGGGAGKVSFAGLSVVKNIDRSSPALRQLVASGNHIPKAVLTLRKSGATPFEFFVVELEKVFVTSVSAGSSQGGDLPTETVTLNFSKITWTYTEQKADGSKGNEIPAGYDVENNLPI